MFAYDVVHLHFRNVYVGYFFRMSVPISEEAISLLGERNKFAPEFLRDCVERISLSRDDLVFRALTILDGIDARVDPEGALERGRAKTTIFLILLQQRQLLNSVNRAEATAVLRELFGRDNTLTRIALVDVRESVALDFRGLSVRQSEFVNYDYFWECEFDGSTTFSECTLKLLTKPEALTISARRANFDMNTCVVDGTVLDALAVQKERLISGKRKKIEDVGTFLWGFYKGGRLYPQREAHLKSKYRGSWDVYHMIRALKDAQVIRTHVNNKAHIGPELIVMEGLEADVLKFILEDNTTEALRRRLSTIKQ